MAGFYGVVAVQPSSFSDTLLCTAGYFFFKQKTAYEILSGLVGSEMCIRDRRRTGIIILFAYNVLGKKIMETPKHRLVSQTLSLTSSTDPSGERNRSPRWSGD